MSFQRPPVPFAGTAIDRPAVRAYFTLHRQRCRMRWDWWAAEHYDRRRELRRLYGDSAPKGGTRAILRFLVADLRRLWATGQHASGQRLLFVRIAIRAEARRYLAEQRMLRAVDFVLIGLAEGERA